MTWARGLTSATLPGAVVLTSMSVQLYHTEPCTWTRWTWMTCIALLVSPLALWLPSRRKLEIMLPGRVQASGKRRLPRKDSLHFTKASTFTGWDPQQDVCPSSFGLPSVKAYSAFGLSGCSAGGCDASEEGASARNLVSFRNVEMGVKPASLSADESSSSWA